MATQLMKDWIIELYNPDRKQTKGYLGEQYSDGSKANCCLGVLCEVDGVEGELKEDDEELIPNSSVGSKTLYYKGMSGLPDTSVIAKVLDRDPVEDHLISTETLDLYEVEEDDWDGNLVERTITADEANDDHGLTFVEIAEKLSERYLSSEEQFEVRKAVEDKGWA